MLGNTLGGRYQLVRHLGGGGFGQTYLAEDLHLPGNPRCVVKQLQPRTTNPDALQAARRLFDSEAQALYVLGNHDQIPRLFAHFEQDEEFYLVQELIEGEVLSQELRTRKHLSESEVINLLQDLLKVLEFVHQQQVVHRDIKPSNLIRRKSDRRLVLIDFGAVKQIGLHAESQGNRHTTVTLAIGSSGYMPNEQMAGKPRFSSDIYAIGMMAIQCLTGIYPEKLPEDPQTSEIIWRDQVQVSSEFADILDIMVRYDYRQRYPSAKEALEALKSLTQVALTQTLVAESTVVSLDGHLAWLERGDELFQLQRFKDAIAAYDRVLQARPGDSLAWFKRGMALENLNHSDEAVASYDKVIQLQPDDYLVWYKRAAVLEKLQRYPEALQSYDHVVRTQPENYWAWHDRGRTLEEMRRFDEAIASYDRAVQLKPDFQLGVESRKRVLSQLQRVDTLYHLQHYDEAVVSCDQAIAQNPNDSLAWLMRGMALENLQQHDEAVLAYDHVVEIQPDDHVAWFKRAATLEKLQRYEEAIASYYKVIQLQPENCWAWHDRARLLEHLNQYEAAIASYDRAIQLKPDLQGAVEARKRLLQQLHSSAMTASGEDEETTVSNELTVPSRSQLNRSINQSITHANLSGAQRASETMVLSDASALKSQPSRVKETTDHKMQSGQTMVCQPLSPAEIEATITAINSVHSNDQAVYDEWLQRGRALEKLQRFAEALAVYDRASALRSDDPDLWHYRGNTLYALSQYKAAIASYETALQLKPDSASTWCCKGRSLTRLKRYQEAMACFDQSSTLQPNSPNPWYLRGRLLAELKQYDKALQCLNRAIQIKPDFQLAIQEQQHIQEQQLAAFVEPESEPERV